MKSRAVLDTNVYISALMFGGLPGALLELATLTAFETLISPAILQELEEKLLFKFGMAPGDCAALTSRLLSFAHLVQPVLKLQVVRQDPDDDRVLECAVEGRASVIVTGDRHLLALNEYAGVKILS